MNSEKNGYIIEKSRSQKNENEIKEKPTFAEAIKNSNHTKQSRGIIIMDTNDRADFLNGNLKDH